MYNIEQLTQLIEGKIKDLQLLNEPKGLFEPIEYILQIGGKRIRPILMLLSYNLYKNDVENIINQALAYEVFHNFTLMHDDVMDNSDIRRGAPTVHKKWNINTAILSGDAMLIEAYMMLMNSEKPIPLNVLEVFSKVALDVCIGQQHDMDFEKQQNIKVEQYLEMIRLKTAVLLSASIATGAILGGANVSDIKLLSEFGEKIGIAFQLQDDLLDTFGDVKTFGKNIGGDIISRKKTYLMLSALSSKDKIYSLKLTELINNKEIDSSRLIAEVVSIYNKLNIKEKTENLILDYYNKSIDCLKKISVTEDKKEMLYKIADLIYKRSK